MFVSLGYFCFCSVTRSMPKALNKPLAQDAKRATTCSEKRFKLASMAGLKRLSSPVSSYSSSSGHRPLSIVDMFLMAFLAASQVSEYLGGYSSKKRLVLLVRLSATRLLVTLAKVMSLPKPVLVGQFSVTSVKTSMTLPQMMNCVKPCMKRTRARWKG